MTRCIRDSQTGSSKVCSSYLRFPSPFPPSEQSWQTCDDRKLAKTSVSVNTLLTSSNFVGVERRPNGSGPSADRVDRFQHQTFAFYHVFHCFFFLRLPMYFKPHNNTSVFSKVHHQGAWLCQVDKHSSLFEREFASWRFLTGHIIARRLNVFW